jgi:acetate kinase
VTGELKRRILTLNRGSSSLKSALYDAGIQNERVLSISVDQPGGANGRLKIADAAGKTLLDSALDGANSNTALEAMLAWTGERGFLAGLAAVGHRLVHGGPRYRDPLKITPEFMTEIEKLIPLDPDHLPAAIAGIKFIAKKFPELPQVACFDTAFHKSLPKVARMYALPRHLYDDGIFRYGFHGLSYEYVMSELQSLDGGLANGRVIIAHLGSGASMVAVKGGKSVDTSMGFTPLEGLVMATRSGDFDPGALLYLIEEKKMSAKEASAMLNKKSGLLGVSGTSGDMKELIEKAGRDSQAADAVDLFGYRAKKYVGAYAAVLRGLDVLVFTGGIGEKAPLVRKSICDGLEFLGIRLESSSNEANAAVISSAESRVKVRVIKTNEDLMIVRHVAALI